MIINIVLIFNNPCLFVAGEEISHKIESLLSKHFYIIQYARALQSILLSLKLHLLEIL